MIGMNADKHIGKKIPEMDGWMDGWIGRVTDSYFPMQFTISSRVGSRLYGLFGLRP